MNGLLGLTYRDRPVGGDASGKSGVSLKMS
jgi:hypothetical protein